MINSRNSKRLKEHSKCLESLEQLPGVGHKTASVVISQGYGKPAFPVDTHIHRLAQRWGLTKGKNVSMTEKHLKELFPEKSWNKEIGERGRSRILEFEVSGFHVDIENLIAAARATSFNNLGKVITMGVESRASIFLSNYISLLPDINIVYSFLTLLI